MFLTPAGWREWRFDSIHGVHTSGRLALSQLGIDTPNAVYSAEYRPIPVREFLRIMAELDIDYSQRVFIDLGAGKGRALLLARRFPFKQVIGVEFSPELARVAQTNLSTNEDPARRCHDVNVFCGDASEYAIPLEPAVIFLNNPFDGPVMARVVENLAPGICVSCIGTLFVQRCSTVRHSSQKHTKVINTASIGPPEPIAFNANLMTNG
jgi:tRNA A58 N-methylase Trm61